MKNENISETELKSKINSFQENIIIDNVIDNDYILINKGVKYTLNFMCIYVLTLSYIYYSGNNINYNVLVLLVCTLSSIMLYILDLYFPSCKI